MLHSRFARVLTFPIVSFGLFVASPFVLYFSGLYRLSLENEWVHELVHLHFVAVGCLFFWPLIGLDPLPGRMPYPLRALLMFLVDAVPHRARADRHAERRPARRRLVSVVGVGWADPFADQRLAGGILWAGGEFVAVAMLGALVFQWMRDSEREARRVDRALDRAEAEQAHWEAAAGSAGVADSAAVAGSAGVADSAAVAGSAGVADWVRSAGSDEAETHR